MKTINNNEIKERLIKYMKESYGDDSIDGAV